MFTAEERKFVLPRKGADRVVVFVFSSVLTGFFALMHVELEHTAASGWLQKILYVLALEAMFVFCIFSFLALLWALFMPSWLESLLSKTTRKVFSVIVLVLAATIFTVLYYSL
jgi:hypothetical protein